MPDINVDLTKTPELSLLSDAKIAGQWVTLPDVHGNCALISYHLHHCRILKNISADEGVSSNAAATQDCYSESISSTDSDDDSSYDDAEADDEAPPYAIYYRQPQQSQDQATIPPKSLHEKLVELYKRHDSHLTNHKNAPTEDYKKIYRKHLQRNIADFKELLGRLVIENDQLKLRFLGDMLADRGVDDYLTLLLLKFLHENNIAFEVIFSNHDAIFMKAFLKKQLNGLADISTIPSASSSIENLSYLLSENIIDEQEIQQLTETCYLPHLKLISYDVYQEDGHKKIKYYTHAPVDFEVIRDMAEKLGVHFQDDSIDDFCKTIDNINAAFSKKIEQGELLAWMDEEARICDAVRAVVKSKLGNSGFRDQVFQANNDATDAIEQVLRKILVLFVTATNEPRKLNDDEMDEELCKLERNYEDSDEDKAITKFIDFFRANLEKIQLANEKKELTRLLDEIPRLHEEHKNAEAALRNLLDDTFKDPHHIKEAPLHTFLWSRIKTASEDLHPNKMHVISCDNGQSFHCRTEYLISNMGWKEHAVNCHGHAGTRGSVIEFDENGDAILSKYYENLDASQLGKRHYYIDGATGYGKIEEHDEGTLIQRYSVHMQTKRKLAAVPGVQSGGNSARFQYGSGSQGLSTEDEHQSGNRSKPPC